MPSVADGVAKATSELLLMPDWDENLRLSDFASSSLPAAQEVIKALTKRLAGTKNPKVAQLCLTLADTLVKNGSVALFQAVGANGDFLNALASTATTKALGDEAQLAAAELLQLLGMAFASASDRTAYPFASLYERLRGNGVSFPPPDHSAVSSLKPSPMPSQPQQAAAAAPAPSPVSAPDPRAVEEGLARATAKLKTDLTGVKRAVSQAARMLSSDGGAAANPMNGSFTLLVEFLQQCKPRLQDLTEGCIGGVITDEAVFETVLSCHEAVSRLLEVALPIAALAHPSRVRDREGFSPRVHSQVADLVSFDSANPTPTPQQPAPAAAAAANGPGVAAPAPAQALVRTAVMSAADDDLLGLFSTAAPASAAAPPAQSAAMAAPGLGMGMGAHPNLTSGPSFSLASFQPTSVGSHAPAAAAAPNPFDSLGSHSVEGEDSGAVAAPPRAAPSAASAAPVDHFASLSLSGASATASAAASARPPPGLPAPPALKAASAGKPALPVASGGDDAEEDPFADFSGSHSARNNNNNNKQPATATATSDSSVLRELDDVLR